MKLTRKRIVLALLTAILTLSPVLLAVQSVQAAAWSKSLSKTISNKDGKVQTIRYAFEVKKDCEVTIYISGKGEDIDPGVLGLVKGNRNLKYDPSGKWVEEKSRKEVYDKGIKFVFKLKKGTYTLVHDCWNSGRKVNIKVSTKNKNLKFLKFTNTFGDMPDDAWM